MQSPNFLSMFQYSLRLGSIIGCFAALALEMGPAQACGDESRIIRSRSLNEHNSLKQSLVAHPLVNHADNIPIQQSPNFFRTKQATPPAERVTNLARVSWSSRELPYPGERNERAGCRGAALADGADGLRALVPPTGYGLTVTEAPTLFFYVPQTVELPIEFTLLDEQGNILYQISFTLPKQAGIVPIDLSALTNEVTLEVGHLYYWFFAIVTDPDDRSGDHLVSGWIERAESDPTLVADLDARQAWELSRRYAQSGIWYDALTAIAALRHTDPANSEYVAQWQDLLESIGFAYLADQPFLEINRSN